MDSPSNVSPPNEKSRMPDMPTYPPFLAKPISSCADVGAAIMTRNTGTETTRTIRRGKELVMSLPAPIVVPVARPLCRDVQRSKNRNTGEGWDGRRDGDSMRVGYAEA